MSEPQVPSAASNLPNRIQPLVALRAFRASIKNPDDTEQPVRVINALSGKTGERLYQRFLQSPKGHEILARECTLLDVLTDRKRLRALPEGSLGRVYLDFLESEELSAEGLVAATEAARSTPFDASHPHVIFMDRMRDTHDLLHVLTGYGRDLIGEGAVVAFTYAQTRLRGIGLLIGASYLLTFLPVPVDQQHLDRSTRSRMRRRVREGYRRGVAASWMIDADWESLLERPIEEVRRAFGISEPIPYEQLRSRGAPALAS